MKFFALCLLLLSTDVQAETWLVGTLFSHHYGSSKDHEEQNWGIGIEQRFTRDFGATAGVYRNSNRRDSLYIGASYSPVKYGKARLGAAFLLVSGYETLKHQELVKAVFPVISIEHRGMGVNIPLIPPTGTTPGVIGLQVKWRF